MSELISFNGSTFIIPDVNDVSWGQNVTDFLIAIPQGCLQKTGGAFVLTANADFGPTFGLVSAYFKSRTALSASAGAVRLANSDSLEWRNAANSGNNTLTVNGADQLVYNGSPLEFNALTNGHIFIGNASNVATDVALSGDIAITNAGVTSIQSGVIVNADINASAAIAYTKLALTGSITNTDIFSSAAIAYSKLNLAGSVNLTSDVTGTLPVANGGTGSAAALSNNRVMVSSGGTIVVAGAITGSKALLSNSNGIPIASSVTDTELEYVSGVTSALQTQINAKQATLTAGQLPGTATNNSASAGNVGEYIESVVGATNAPTSGQFGDLTSINLTAGDWDVTGTIHFEMNSASTSGIQIGISSTSGNSSTGTVLGSNRFNGSWTASVTAPLTFDAYVPSYRVSLASPTTYYLKFLVTYTVATPQGQGRISARRMR